MSRVEKEETEHIKSMRDEVVQSVHEKRTSGHAGKTFGVILLVMLLAIAGWILWILASTGLFSIPVFSMFAFQKPVPVRVVTAGLTAESVASNDFKAELTQRLTQDGGKLSNRSVALALPESALTATLQQSVRQSSLMVSDASTSQIAILPNNQLEIFLPVKYHGNTTAIVAHVTLHANKGALSIDLDDVRLGSLHLPDWIVASSVQSSVDAELASFSQVLGSYMEVDSLSSNNGVLTLAGIFTVQVK